MDRFGEFYDVMKDDMDYYLQLRRELNIAGVSARECIEGLKYARSLVWMKFEYDNMRNRMQQMRSDSYNIWLTLQNLKQEKEMVANELDVLKLMKDNYLNDRQIEEPSNQKVSFVRRRRRHIST